METDTYKQRYLVLATLRTLITVKGDENRANKRNLKLGNGSELCFPIFCLIQIIDLSSAILAFHVHFVVCEGKEKAPSLPRFPNPK